MITQMIRKMMVIVSKHNGDDGDGDSDDGDGGDNDR